MLKYSELSPAQKKVVDAMKNGAELKLSMQTWKYILSDGKFTTYVPTVTTHSLELRQYIEIKTKDEHFVTYILNPQIDFGEKNGNR